MMTDRSQGTLKRMEAMLRRCRRRIMLAELSVRLREGLEFYLIGLVAITGISLLVRVVCWTAQTSVTLDSMHVLTIAVVSGVVIFGRAFLLGIFGKPIHAAIAAERLDLSQSTHNRIATAMALLRRGDDSPFANAAIRDGVEYLDKLQAERPYVEAPTTSWRRQGACLALILAMVLGGQLLGTLPQLSNDSEPTTPGSKSLAHLDHEPANDVSDSPAKPKRQVISRDNRQVATDVPAPDDDTGEADTDQHDQSDSESDSEGLASQHASGKSRTSQSSSHSSKAAIGAGGKSEPGKTEPGEKKKPRLASKPTADPPNVEQKNEKGGSINARASSGSGSMRTAQNEWSSEVKGKSSDSDDFEQEEEPDEEMDQEKQRLGMQPALKNRTSRVSRELSLTMGTGLLSDMTKGRGGSNAPKKARGTATMIMGVPVPGFVRGRLLPGPTKSTQEEVEPTPREGGYAVASELQQANPEEAPQEHYRPLAAMSVLARDYLIKYHAENENIRIGTATDE